MLNVNAIINDCCSDGWNVRCLCQNIFDMVKGGFQHAKKGDLETTPQTFFVGISIQTNVYLKNATQYPSKNLSTGSGKVDCTYHSVG